MNGKTNRNCGPAEVRQEHVMFEEVTNVKSEFFLLIDDRCIRFNGTWGGLAEHVKHFNPYWKAQC